MTIYIIRSSSLKWPSASQSNDNAGKQIVLNVAINVISIEQKRHISSKILEIVSFLTIKRLKSYLRSLVTVHF